MMYKHIGHVFCLNISSKTRNPMDFVILYSTEVSAMVL